MEQKHDHDYLDSEEGSSKPISRSDQVRQALLDYIRFPEFKRLLSQIHSLQEDRGIKSLAVLSEFPGEGKTFFVSVLALGYAAYLDKRVLIMDTISQTRDESFYFGRVLGRDGASFNTKMSAHCSGLIDLIATKSLCRQIRQKKNKGSGESSKGQMPALVGENVEYGNSDFRIGAFIDSLKYTYDVILLDTCALRTANKSTFDPIILARQAHASLLITSNTSLQHEHQLSRRKELAKNQLGLIGTVYNSGITAN